MMNIHSGTEEAETDKATASSADTLHSGQARMAYRLAATYADDLLYVHGVGWLTWDGARWSDDDPGEPKRAVLETLRLAMIDSFAAGLGEDKAKALRQDVHKCESASGVAGVLDLAAALEPFAVTVADLDADPYLLNVHNGTLDLRTLEVRDHDPADRITKITRAAWDPTAPAGSWDAFLAQVLPDGAVREFVQRLVGVGLLGVVVEHVLPIFTGTGANGKSVLDATLRYALGDYASTVEPDLFLHRQGAHPTGEMDLLGKRWVVVSETEKDRRLAEATMKRLTGGDTIRARRMRQDFVEFTPSHTPVLITNHLPKVSGDDPAIWRRLRVVPFDVVIPPEHRDKHLAERLQADADAVLAWAVQGYADYAGRGELAEPASVLAATSDYQKSSDAVARFLDDRCIRNPNMFAETAALFRDWSTWALDDGAEPLSLRAFGEALDSHGFPVSKSNGRRVRRGIGLYADDKEGDS
jgi:putative DNA primase/helicase